ncbi:flagellin [Methanofollis aquaemaris]|uniref:Flagellin n=1 Tax=Methanofollis aquaemaris TaxID=126734 RepID=A0A8A3S268_9EURY|nr:flagellin [Methanofollis aquaemaris]QSZ66295.1 flagellin [Methanofollis aquaemaris]
MSSETITTAILLIGAVIAAGVLVNAIFPIIYTISDTAGSTSHAVDQQARTDIKIINAYVSASNKSADIWIKNLGSTRIAVNELSSSDIFIGKPGEFNRISYSSGWTYDVLDGDSKYWLPGETILIDIDDCNLLPTVSGDVVYFQIVLPGGTVRSTEFTAGA